MKMELSLRTAGTVKSKPENRRVKKQRIKNSTQWKFPVRIYIEELRAQASSDSLFLIQKWKADAPG
jgi:hypothetical protein